MAGFFVTFEGPEGSGKTTQIQLLATWLRGCGLNVLTTREPGGTRLGDAIRSLLLNPEHVEMLTETEILLFSAARAQLVGQVIQPHLAAGGTVLCDRFADSTLAYQGYGRRVDLATLRQITSFATRGLQPDLTFCLDLPVAEGLQRKEGGAAEEWNRMEREEREFHQRARTGYLALAAGDPVRWRVLDARAAITRLQDQIREQVAARLKETA